MPGTLRIGVHPSVDGFEPETLCRALTDLDHEVTPVQADGDVGSFDAIVTLDHDDRWMGGDVEWLHFISAGVDHVPLDEYAAAGMTVTNSRGVHSECMAENALGLMITLAHRLHRFRDEQRSREWNRDRAWTEKFRLAGETVTVLGLGAIGATVAEYATGIGMEVYGVKRTPEPVDGVAEVFGNDRREEPLSRSRFLVIALPLTDETRHSIGRTELAAMPDDAYLLNLSRGEVVDEAALVDALQREELAGAALDVFEEEPLPEDSPLWRMDEVVITPHVSGAFAAYHESIADLVRTNVDRLLADRDLLNRVI